MAKEEKSRIIWILENIFFSIMSFRADRIKREQEAQN
jgi:hypothetical protein